MTLTYDQEHLPPNGGLRYRDLTLFWKRLRKRYGKLSYFAVGEYGDESLRPHYHACLFGHDFREEAIRIRTDPHPLWISLELTATWGHGHVAIGSLTFETARYTASYLQKKLAKNKRYVTTDQVTGELIPLEQPRSFMSRNLARSWWEQWGRQVTAHDYCIINARKQKPPKAYDRWLGEVNEERLIQIKETRVRKLRDHERRKTREQLQHGKHARTLNAHARTERKSKSV